jgi:hypothetical protein
VARRSLSGAGATLALVLSLLLPAAVQGDGSRLPPIDILRLQASNGYVFFALAEAPPEESEEDEENEAGSAFTWCTAVTYATPATVTDRTIEADLGKLGRISVTRAPTGRTRTVPRSCKPGDKRTKQAPVERYEGTIEFHGEEGFTDVSATSAPLTRVYCATYEEGGGGSGSRRTLPGARLDVEKRRPEQYRLEFDAIQRRPGAGTGVSVEVEEHRGEMEIHRATWTWASPGALRYDRRLRNATVRPPAPFSGHATFHRRAHGANRWTGNLTVDLPGNSDVPITGRGFWAELEHPRS